MTRTLAGLTAFINRIKRLAAGWSRAIAADRYRPEKHYMRGPGPKNLGRPSKGGRNSEA